MKQEQAVVDIHITDSRASLAISRHIGQFIVFAESLSVAGRPDAAGNIIFLAYNIIPDTVDGMNISRIPGQCGNVCHTGIHISGTHGMSHRLILFRYRLMRLAVFIRTAGMSPLVKEEFCLIQVFLLPRYQIELGKRHLGNLMAGHTDLLSGTGAYLTAYAVGITDSDIQKITLPGRLVMSNGPLYHVSQIIELMAQFLHLFPTLAARPFVRMLGIHGTAGVKVSVRLLCGSDDHQHAVNVFGQLFIRISLQQVTGPLYRLIYIRIIKSQPAHFDGIAGMGRIDKIPVSSRLLTFTESQGNGHFTAGLETLPPERVGHFHRSERHRVYRITV